MNSGSLLHKYFILCKYRERADQIVLDIFIGFCNFACLYNNSTLQNALMFKQYETKPISFLWSFQRMYCSWDKALDIDLNNLSYSYPFLKFLVLGNPSGSVVDHCMFSQPSSLICAPWSHVCGDSEFRHQHWNGAHFSLVRQFYRPKWSSGRVSVETRFWNENIIKGDKLFFFLILCIRRLVRGFCIKTGKKCTLFYIFFNFCFRNTATLL